MSHLPHLYAPCKGEANGVFTISISILNHLHHIFAEPNLRKKHFFSPSVILKYILFMIATMMVFIFFIAIGHIPSDFKTNKI